jgi:hypothetical protein
VPCASQPPFHTATETKSPSPFLRHSKQQQHQHTTPYVATQWTPNMQCHYLSLSFAWLISTKFCKCLIYYEIQTN